MRLIDTHCHIHEKSYPLDADEVLGRAREKGVEKLICVGTDLESSRDAVTFSGPREGVFASLGIHPHEAKDASKGQIEALSAILSPKIVAIGEIGLDYFYSHSSREEQLPLLEAQLQLATDRNLPVIFHVRRGRRPAEDNPFNDFWPILSNFPGTRGVLHSFTDTAQTLEKALANGLFIGVNGISTFTKDPVQQAMFASIPVEKLLLETDAPFLTPSPLRGTINESANVSLVASFHASVRGISEDNLAAITTASAEALFRFS